ncbi:MAG: hypothetical protein WCI47_03345 [bacterium]
MNQELPIKKIAIVLISIVVFGLLGFFVLRNVFFMIDKTNIDSQQVPSSLPAIIIEFNKEIDPTQNLDAALKISPEVKGKTVSIQKNKLEVRYDSLEVKQKYQVILTNLKSIDGKNITQTLSFTTVFVAVKDQTKEQIERGVDETDQELKKFPILNDLPYETEEYKIEGSVSDNQEKVDYTITLLAVYNRPEQAESYQSDLRLFKKNALAWLTSRNIDITNSKITYLPEDPDKPNL